MTEEWRAIDGFPGYQVSSLGRIQSFRKGTLFGSILRPSTANKHGRAIVTIYRSGRPEYRLISRLVCRAFKGMPPSTRHQAAHLDGDRFRDHADNLAWKTPKQNADDRDMHGKTAKGENHYAAKTTENIVLEIRQMHAEKKTLNRHYGAIPALAIQFGLTNSAVEDIVRRRKWKHI